MTDTKGDTLDVLVEQARSGNRKAFSVLVRQLMKPVAALTYRITGDRDSALDIAQDSFLAAWENLPGFRGDSSFASWVFRIATNKALNYRKSASVSRVESDDIDLDYVDSAASPDVILDQKALASDLMSFMHALPEQQRVVFNLRFYQHMTFDEIAQTTERALGTVKTSYREAVKKLRDFARERGWHS